jgi:mannose-6-phosphate isomerase-like protein (cupin superfamily)
MKTMKGRNYAAAETGALRDLKQHAHRHPKLGTIPGKLFLKEPLGLTGMEASIGVMPPGVGMPFLHRHREHEELYLFVGGKGQFVVDGDVIDVQEGTVIRVSPEGARAWRNNSTEPLYYVCIQATAGTIKGDATSDGMGVDAPVVWKEMR